MRFTQSNTSKYTKKDIQVMNETLLTFVLSDTDDDHNVENLELIELKIRQWYRKGMSVETLHAMIKDYLPSPTK